MTGRFHMSRRELLTRLGAGAAAGVGGAAPARGDSALLRPASLNTRLTREYGVR
jgi:hypothetical protein